MTDIADLKPCPFCGGNKLHAFDNAVHCEECDASGPDLGHCVGIKCRHEAMSVWNTRPLDAKDKRIAELSGGWQPIEMAPKDGTLVLLGKAGDPDWPPRCRRWQDTHWRGWDAEDATHWQPLPAPPSRSLLNKEEENG